MSLASPEYAKKAAKRWKPKNERAYSEGRKRFEYALRSKGPDGIWKQHKANRDVEAAQKKRAAQNVVEAAALETLKEGSLRFGYSHIPAERWNSIFGQPGEQDGDHQER